MKERDPQHPIVGADHLRFSPPFAERVQGFKEWTYFCVSTRDLDLLVTFTFLDRMDDGRHDGAPAARVVAVARRRGGRWIGGVDEVPPSAVRATPGRVDLAMGASELRFNAGAYALIARLASCPIEAHLRLRPLGLPAVGDSVRLGSGGPMRWIVVPRLEAHGEVRIDGERHEINGAPAYHDHNWGVFSWGGDFAWEWGLVLPPTIEVPWTVIYSRITDRARQTVLSQDVLVWHDTSSFRAFRGDEISVTESGLLRGGAKLRIPPVMSLVEPGTTADVPRGLVARAESGRDRLSIRLAMHDFVEIAVPNETSALGTTLLCEARADALVRGTIRGETVDLSGPAILELNRGAASPRPPSPLRAVR